MKKQIAAAAHLAASDRILLFPIGNNYYAFGECAEKVAELTGSAVEKIDDVSIIEIMGEVIENTIRELSGKTGKLVSVVRSCTI
jgi:hypothetical protein